MKLRGFDRRLDVRHRNDGKSCQPNTMNTPTSQQSAARDYVAFWSGKGYEKGQTQPFWTGREGSGSGDVMDER